EAVGAGGDEELVVRVEGKAEHGVGGGLDHPLGGAVGGVPEADGSALVARGDLGAVAPPGDPLDISGAAVEGLGGRGGGSGGLPEVEGLAGGVGDLLAVGAGGQGVDASRLIGEVLGRAAAGADPDLGRLVQAARQDALAVGAGGDGQDQAG